MEQLKLTSYWQQGIPTWKDGEWIEHTVFQEISHFREFVKSVFKIPGEYDLDETSNQFNEHARFFDKNSYYCIAPFRSKDFTKYWDESKLKCRRGVIFIHGNKTWYLPREYYMWINFLKIYDKLAKRFSFPSVWDVQLHMALYELLAELHGEHAFIVKKRQIASSYYHTAKLINELWFEEGSTLKIGASESRYIDMEGTWEFLEQYRNFLNTHTGWYRPMDPAKVGSWQQRIKVEENGREKFIGNQSRIIGLSFEKSATKGVGGACRYFFYEEAGVAPTMDKSYIYMQSALESGEISTGLFIGAGSVGELKDCGPLKEFVMNPTRNSVYAVETDLIDEKGTIGKSGLFIPEQWGMPPYIDDYGNSLVKPALESLNETYKRWEKELLPEVYQLKVSQKPRNLAEAFAYREESKFPQHIVSWQERRINENEYPYELIELEEQVDGTLKARKTSKPPLSMFPVDPKLEDKSGSIVVYERPDENAEWGTYIASIDPVAEGKTITSDSLCSIYVYKMPVSVTRMTENGTENFIEGDKVVASWCGRFDDINKTHDRLRKIIIWFNAWTLIENNISLFIQYMIEKRLTKFLVPKNQIVFLKEATANSNAFQDFGWRNVGTIFRVHLLNYLIEFVKEVIDEETDSDGKVIKRIYGIVRIPDIMGIREMQAYRDGLNVDRLVALAALIAFVKVLISNRGYKSRFDNQTELNLEKSKELYKLNTRAFSSMGRDASSKHDKNKRSPFKHIR